MRKTLPYVLTLVVGAAVGWLMRAPTDGRDPDIGDELYVSYPDAESPVGRKGAHLVITDKSRDTDHAPDSPRNRRTPSDWMIHVGGRGHTVYLIAHPPRTTAVAVLPEVVTP